MFLIYNFCLFIFLAVVFFLLMIFLEESVALIVSRGFKLVFFLIISGFTMFILYGMYCVCNLNASVAFYSCFYVSVILMLCLVLHSIYILYIAGKIGMEAWALALSISLFVLAPLLGVVCVSVSVCALVNVLGLIVLFLFFHVKF